MFYGFPHWAAWGIGGAANTPRPFQTNFNFCHPRYWRHRQYPMTNPKPFIFMVLGIGNTANTSKRTPNRFYGPFMVFTPVRMP